MSHLFSELKTIQEQDGYLKEDRLKELSKRRRVPLYTLQGVATFYPHFRLSPPPRLEVKVCRDFSCHLRGAKQTADAVEALIDQNSITSPRPAAEAVGAATGSDGTSAAR